MSEEERSLTGLVKRAWVIDQAKKVYEDFKKKEAALLVQELLDNEVMPVQVVVNADFSVANLLIPVEHQQLALVENLGSDTVVLDNQGLECASQSSGGLHEDFVTSNSHSLGFQGEPALPTSQLPPDTQSGMGINNKNELFNFPHIVQNQQELITHLRQQLQERDAQISVLRNENGIQQQQLTESRAHIFELESQRFVQQQLQVINQGVPNFEVEQSILQQNYPCRPHGSAFW